MNAEIARCYKRGRGKILEWVIKIENYNNKVNIFISYGELEGQKTITYQNDIKGKNKGKANETTAWEQAQLIAHSKTNNKEREGYKRLDKLEQENQDTFYNSSLIAFLEKVLPAYNTDISGNEIPMKCQQYYRSKKDYVDSTGKKWDDRKYYFLENPFADKKKEDLIITFPCYVQPKVNGVRAFIKLANDKVKIFSKKGLEYNLPHIAEWFTNNKDLFTISNGQEIIFDGELYIPGEALQNISSAVKAMQLNTALVKFYMFDIAIEDMIQKERFKELYSIKIKERIQMDLNTPIVLVQTLNINTDARVQELTDIYISQGYEGSICRDPEGLYEFGKRPKTITKLKRTVSEEFLIIDVISQEVDPSLGLFVCKVGNQEVKVNPKGDEAFKRRVLTQSSSFIGKELTCTFYEYTEAGLPFHIIDNIVRDYE